MALVKLFCAVAILSSLLSVPVAIGDSQDGCPLGTDMKVLWGSAICRPEDGCTCLAYTSHRFYCKAGSLYIDLSACGIHSLTRFNAEFPKNFSRLVSLDLSRNHIRLKDGAFSGQHFTDLRSLNLTANFERYRSTTVPPGVFKGLKNLQMLSVSLMTTTDSSVDDQGNFTLDENSTGSLLTSLQELHVTGSHVMHGLHRLEKLSVLNLGGTNCYLSPSSNLDELAQLQNLSRLSFRGCGMSDRSMILNKSILKSVVYLDVSCASITFSNIRCFLPPSLRVLIIDQDDKFSDLREPCKMPHSTTFNITAMSLTNYYRDTLKYLPTVNGHIFPKLTSLDLSNNPYSYNDIKDLLNFQTSNLSYLQDLDISSFGTTKTTFPCSYQQQWHHPWFLSTDKHVLPPSSQPYIPCTNCLSFVLPPRLGKLTTQHNEKFALNLEHCRFQSNNLTEVDISNSELTKSNKFCDSGIAGLDSVKTVLATEVEFLGESLDLAFILRIFPNMNNLDLRGSKNLMSFGDLHHSKLEHLVLDGIGKQTFQMNIRETFPSMVELTVSGSAIEQFSVGQLSISLLTLNLSHNSITYIDDDTRSTLTEHAKSQPRFQFDITGNSFLCSNCKCNTSNFLYIQWVLNSTNFVLYSDRCLGGLPASPCVNDNQCEVSTSPLPSGIGGIVAGGVAVVVIAVALFFIVRRYHWRIRFWFTDTCQGERPVQDELVASKFYLSYCTSSENQKVIAFNIWQRAQSEDFPIVIRSRFDLLPGMTTNVMLTKYMREVHKVLLLMPDEQYSLNDESLYELQLAIRFHQVHNIHAISASKEVRLADISARFPPLIAGALQSHCKPIYPPFADDEDIRRFFDDLLDVWTHSL